VTASILLPIVIGITHEHALGTEATILAVLAVTCHLKVDLSLARGLDYYTGAIFETQMSDHPEFWTVSSGEGMTTSRLSSPLRFFRE
jgi:histidyl-tRNA synthetase